MKIFLVLSLSLVFSGAAFAATEKQAVQLNVAAGDVPGQVQAIQTVILEKQYVEMTASDKAALNRHFSMLKNGELDAGAAVAAQDQVNAILKKAYADSRLYCKSQSVMGTNRKERACMTMAQKRATYENTQLDMKRNLVPGSTPLEIQ